MDHIARFLDVLTPYGTHSYFLMFGVLLACGFGFPMPEDVILITGGILSARGVCHLWLTTLVCMAGVLIGDGVVFFAGRYFGPQVKRTWIFKKLMTDAVDSRIVRVFAKYGDKVVFFGRFMPGLRTPIFLSAGIYRLSPWKFFLLDGFAALISVPLWVYVGFLFGDNLEILEDKIKQFQFSFFAAIAGLLSVVVLVVILKRRSSSSA